MKTEIELFHINDKIKWAPEIAIVKEVDDSMTLVTAVNVWNATTDRTISRTIAVINYPSWDSTKEFIDDI